MRRLVVLGASNAVAALPRIVAEARELWGSPLDLLAAVGHGRSYGHASRVLWRTLPGILDCGLWEELARRPPAPLAALVTDIGNDILYGAATEAIAGWVEACLRRLAGNGASLIITELPLASLEAVGTTRFLILRSLLFPRSVLSLPAARTRARALNDQVVSLADCFAAERVVPARTWYGLDPIHIRRGCRDAAWQEIFHPWRGAAASVESSTRAYRHQPREWLVFRRLQPQQRRVWGRTRQCAQPAAVLADGTRISLY